MSFLTIDFETYWADDYSLNKMTTEEYIRDPRFEVIGVSVKEDNGEATWFSGTHEQTKAFLTRYDIARSAVLHHHAHFDGAILEWIFDKHPAYYFDSLCIARPLHGVDAGGSLKTLLERYKLRPKGNDLQWSKGKRRADFTFPELINFGDYCNNDVEGTFDLFNAMLAAYDRDNGVPFPQLELDLIDATVRMFTQPTLELDDGLLTSRLEELRNDKLALLGGLMHLLQVGTEEEVRKKLASNPQFAKLLIDCGVPNPPTKPSPKHPEKQIWAFAKTDEGFLELQQHPDPVIQQLCAVRLGVKSTIEESRLQRFIDIGARNKGKLPVPLKYYGAHTGRMAGMDEINLQNIPTRDKRKKALKNSIVAPDGYLLLNGDSSQIEARDTAWIAGQNNVVEAFAQGRDIYCEDATKVYKRLITKADPTERAVGKEMRLQLGFGAGHVKLHSRLSLSLRENAPALAECKVFVDDWRSDNYMIKGLWKDCDSALPHLASWPKDLAPYPLGYHGVVWVTPEGLLLPNGMYIRYPNLRSVDDQWVYDSRKGPVNIWGGVMTENIAQALARIIVMEQLVKVRQRFPVALTVHDSILAVVPEHEIAEAQIYVADIMSTPPVWALTLPVACETKVGKSYGEC